MYEYHATLIRAIDGDTVELDIDLGCCVHSHQICRLRGVNCPEVSGPDRDSGNRATLYTRFALNEQVLLIKTHKDSSDKYGRLLVDIWIDGVLFNDTIVTAGHAVKKAY